MHPKFPRRCWVQSRFIEGEMFIAFSPRQRRRGLVPSACRGQEEGYYLKASTETVVKVFVFLLPQAEEGPVSSAAEGKRGIHFS
jgi:hypothetical protein